MNKWKILSQKLLFSAKPWFEVTKQVVELPNGLTINNYYQINQPNYVEIAPINDRGKILMCRRYKHGIRKETIGFPGGYIEPDETPLNAAKRELHEECSLKSSNWKCLGSDIVFFSKKFKGNQIFFE